MKPNVPTMPPIEGLHHWAIKCRDAEETRHFYEDILGLPLAHIIKADYVPSTKQHCPYVHLFFKMGDGSYVAFFDLGDDLAPDPSPNTPSWVNHMALRMNSVEDVEGAGAAVVVLVAGGAVVDVVVGGAAVVVVVAGGCDWRAAVARRAKVPSTTRA